MNRFCVRALFVQITLLTIALAPLCAKAQFKDPTPEELHMTSDPKAPGADAVYLDYEESRDDEMHTQTVYARIKVLTEKGKEHASIEVLYPSSFFAVDNIKARTIHSDGTIVPLEGKPEDLLYLKKGEVTINRKVFNLPSVEVGSILEYRYKLRNDGGFIAPHWYVQKNLFVHHAHYYFSPFHDFLKNQGMASGSFLVNSRGQALDKLYYVFNLPEGAEVKIDGAGHYSLDVDDIPATPSEEWMPPLDSTLYDVHFYYSNAHNVKDYWLSESKLWSKDVDHFADHDNTLKGIAAGLVAPTDTDLIKAQKLYTAVQALDNTDFSRVKSSEEMKQLGEKQAKRAEETWQQKSGSREDITLLYLALLRAVGIKAYDMKVVDRSNADFNTGYLYFDQLTDDVILANLNGKEMVLDPGEKMCPFGTVSWHHSGAGGIRQADGGPVGATLPLQSYKDNTLNRKVSIKLNEDGSISGKINYFMNGQSALHWRQLAIRKDESEVKKQFDNELRRELPQGVTGHLDHFIGLGDPDSALIAIVKVEGGYATATSKRLLVPAYFFNSAASHPFTSTDKRLAPVDMHYAEEIKDELAIQLPAGFKLEATPQPASASWPAHALLGQQIQADSSSIDIIQLLARAFTLVKPEEYQDLHNFYRQVMAADQQQLTLVRTDVAAR